jgi:hypothetical protein
MRRERSEYYSSVHHTSTSELVDRDAGIEIDSDGIAVEITHVGLEGINLDDSPVLGIRIRIYGGLGCYRIDASRSLMREEREG